MEKQAKKTMVNVFLAPDMLKKVEDFRFSSRIQSRGQKFAFVTSGAGILSLVIALVFASLAYDVRLGIKKRVKRFFNSIPDYLAENVRKILYVILD